MVRVHSGLPLTYQCAHADALSGGPPALFDAPMEPPTQQCSQGRAVCVSHAGGDFIDGRAARFQEMHRTLHPQALEIRQRRLLMRDDSSRANTVFGLREFFPLYCGCPPKFASSEEVPKLDPVLTGEVKRILVWARLEADAVRDYWIDTEHLLLGTLHEKRCLAGRYLLKAGFTLRSARRTMLENKSSRPDYGPISQWWALQSPWDRFMAKWRSRMIIISGRGAMVRGLTCLTLFVNVLQYPHAHRQNRLDYVAA